MRIYDCTLTLKQGVVVYPGDPPFTSELVTEDGVGGECRIRRLSMGSHTGTHIDAPAHLLPGGRTLEQFPLQLWLGPVRVVAVASEREVKAEDLGRADPRGCTRLFIKTQNSTLWNDCPHLFVKDHVYLSAEAARYLAGLQLLLVGFDYLSVDRYGDHTLPAHHILLEQGIPIVEGLNLASVRPGDYQLVCAPLCLAHAEAAPARVFLLEE